MLPIFAPLLLLCLMLVVVLTSFGMVLVSYFLWAGWLALSLVQTLGQASEVVVFFVVASVAFF